jgi:hypothetical protein
VRFTEEEWQSVYDVVYAELKVAYDSMKIDCSPGTISTLAGNITTSILTSPALVLVEDDISVIPGIHIERITIERIAS